jgi:hypothetical protein
LLQVGKLLGCGGWVAGLRCYGVILAEKYHPPNLAKDLPAGPDLGRLAGCPIIPVDPLWPNRMPIPDQPIGGGI